MNSTRESGHNLFLISRPGWVGSGLVWSGRVGSGLIGSDLVRSGRVGSGGFPNYHEMGSVAVTRPSDP